MGEKIPVFPAPWSVERELDGVSEIGAGGYDSLDDLGDKGLLDNRNATGVGSAFRRSPAERGGAV